MKAVALPFVVLASSAPANVACDSHSCEPGMEIDVSVAPYLAAVDCTMTLSNGAYAAHYRFAALPSGGDAGAVEQTPEGYPCTVIDGPQPTICVRDLGDTLRLYADDAGAQGFIDALHIRYDGKSAPLWMHVACGTGTVVADQAASACIIPD